MKYDLFLLWGFFLGGFASFFSMGSTGVTHLLFHLLWIFILIHHLAEVKKTEVLSFFYYLPTSLPEIKKASG